MKNKDELKNKIVNFRDKFKEYREVCRKIWSSRHYSLDDTTLNKEEEIRENLTETWGQLEKIFKKIGAPYLSMVPTIGYPTMFFDEALSADFDSPHKGDGIDLSISSATKAIGLVEALSDKELSNLDRRTPVLFLSHAFRDENVILVNRIKELLSSFNMSVVTGAKPSIGSITEKVKSLIDDSNFILAILTKDDEQKDKTWLPSKWVYDEIAYACGQKKPTILMLEEGVKHKSGISGDSEYITFKRDNLTEATIKLVTVLNGLLNK